MILKGADWSEIYENNVREKGELTDGGSANGRYSIKQPEK